MSSSETAYKYTIPLDKTRERSTPIYSAPSKGEKLYARYTATNLVVVRSKPSPHFHRDSVNVQVEEVDKSDYEN